MAEPAHIEQLKKGMATAGLYELFGLNRHATKAEIRNAYRAMAKIFHPDQSQGGRHVEEVFKAISAGARILLDPKLRELYDRGKIDANGKPTGTASAPGPDRAYANVALYCFLAAFVVTGAPVGAWFLYRKPAAIPIAAAGSSAAPATVVSSEPVAKHGPLKSPDADSGLARSLSFRWRNRSIAVAEAAEGADKIAGMERDAEKRLDSGVEASVETPITADEAGAKNPGVAAIIAGADAENVRSTTEEPSNAARLPEAKPAAGDAKPIREQVSLDPKEQQRTAAAGAQFYLERGLAQLDAGDSDQAKSDLDEALRLEPDNPMAFYGRGVLLRRQGKFDLALSDLDRAVRASFSNARFYNERGLTWSEKGRYDRAIADFDRAVKIEPEFASAYRNRGFAWLGKSDFTHAIEDYTKAIGIGAPDPHAYSDRGWAYHLARRNREALADLDKALELEPANITFQTRRLQIFEASRLRAAGRR